jgi:hypothetical protein
VASDEGDDYTSWVEKVKVHYVLVAKGGILTTFREMQEPHTGKAQRSPRAKVPRTALSRCSKKALTELDLLDHLTARASRVGGTGKLAVCPRAQRPA